MLGRGLSAKGVVRPVMVETVGERVDEVLQFIDPMREVNVA
jgi:hypothetical protein